jgi:hypothetical protein
MPPTTDNLRFILGLKLRRLRREQGASLREVADASGLSVSYLSEIEKGKKYPKPDKLIRLASAFGVSYDDLVSLDVTDELGPLKEVFSSTFIQEFPFSVFGLEPQDLFGLVSDQPSRAAALIRTFLEIGRTYDMQVEHFLFAALRSFQQLHGNYFADLEDRARAFRRANGWTGGAPPSRDALRDLLIYAYNYTLDFTSLPGHPDLGDLRSVYVNGLSPTLAVNGDLMDIQQAFLFAREIGYCELDVDERARTSSWLEVESYDQVLNNFRASYFAGAVIMERNALLDDLRAFFGQPHWDPAPLRAMMTRIQATPEMLFYRLTELVPHAFGLDDFFFLRFHHTVGSEDVELTKILNMSQVAVPHGIGLQEHYCRRWPAIRLLRDMAQRQTGSAPPTNGTAGADIHAQRSVYLKDDVEFFVLSCARPLALQPRTNSCVSIGFLLNETFRDTVRFWADDSLPRVHVGLTCERCPLPPETCRERVAPPSADEARKAQDRKKTALAELTRSLRS